MTDKVIQDGRHHVHGKRGEAVCVKGVAIVLKRERDVVEVLVYVICFPSLLVLSIGMVHGRVKLESICYAD